MTFFDDALNILYWIMVVEFAILLWAILSAGLAVFVTVVGAIVTAVFGGKRD